METESPYILFYELRGLQERYDYFRAIGMRHEDKATVSPALDDEDDQEYKDMIKGGGGARTSGRSGCRHQ